MIIIEVNQWPHCCGLWRISPEKDGLALPTLWRNGQEDDLAEFLDKPQNHCGAYILNVPISGNEDVKKVLKKRGGEILFSRYTRVKDDRAAKGDVLCDLWIVLHKKNRKEK